MFLFYFFFFFMLHYESIVFWIAFEHCSISFSAFPLFFKWWALPDAVLVWNGKSLHLKYSYNCSSSTSYLLIPIQLYNTCTTFKKTYIFLSVVWTYGIESELSPVCSLRCHSYSSIFKNTYDWYLTNTTYAYDLHQL